MQFNLIFFTQRRKEFVLLEEHLEINLRRNESLRDEYKNNAKRSKEEKESIIR